MSRFNRRQQLAFLAVLAGAILGAAVPASSAVSFLSSGETWNVAVESPALLEARGAAVTVQVDVTCPQGAFAQLSLTVTQRAGNGTTAGSRSLEPTCSGQPQVLSVSVVAQSGSRVFKKGPAFADAVLSGCGYTCGEMVTDSRTISITR